MNKNQKKKKGKNSRNLVPAKPNGKGKNLSRVHPLLMTPLLSITKLEQFPFIMIVAIIVIAYCYLFKK